MEQLAKRRSYLPKASLECFSPLRMFSCKHCAFKTTHKLILRRHLNINGSPPHEDDFSAKLNLECNLCMLEINSHLNYFLHVRYKCQLRGNSDSGQPGNKWYNCEICPFETHYKDTLRNHIASKHIDSDRIICYECEKCSHRNKSEKKLIEHIKVQHRIRTYPYDRCLHKIQFSHGFRQFVCSHCDYKSGSRQDVDRHIVRKHLDPQRVKWHFCSMCSYKGKLKVDVLSHKKMQHPRPNRTEWYQCPKCTYRNKRKDKLNQHEIARHPELVKDLIWYQCEKCPYTTNLKRYLTLHEKSKHSVGTKHYSCSQCDFKSHRKQNLTTHMISIHADPQDIIWYGCDKCLYKAKHKSSLYVHVRTHHSGQMFQCDKCYYQTKRSDGLKAHRNNKHPEDFDEWYECSQCVFKTKIKKQFNNHKNGHKREEQLRNFAY